MQANYRISFCPPAAATSFNSGPKECSSSEFKLLGKQHVRLTSKKSALSAAEKAGTKNLAIQL
jgi:hypothetical protein